MDITEQDQPVPNKSVVYNLSVKLPKETLNEPSTIKNIEDRMRNKIAKIYNIDKSKIDIIVNIKENFQDAIKIQSLNQLKDWTVALLEASDAHESGGDLEITPEGSFFNYREIPSFLPVGHIKSVENNIKIFKSLPPANEVSDPNYKPLTKTVFVNKILTKDSELQLKALLKQINIALAKLGDEQQPVEAPTEPVEAPIQQVEEPTQEEVTITVQIKEVDPRIADNSYRKDALIESANESIYEETGIIRKVKEVDNNTEKGMDVIIVIVIIGIIMLINFYFIYKLLIK